jgi:hypothetical protein
VVIRCYPRVSTLDALGEKEWREQEERDRAAPEITLDSSYDWGAVMADLGSGPFVANAPTITGGSSSNFRPVPS